MNRFLTDYEARTPIAVSNAEMLMREGLENVEKRIFVRIDESLKLELERCGRHQVNGLGIDQ